MAKFPVGIREFSFLQIVQTGWWALGVPSPSVNRLGSKADHTLPSSADVKSDWRCTLIRTHAFKAYLVTALLFVLCLLLP